MAWPLFSYIIRNPTLLEMPFRDVVSAFLCGPAPNNPRWKDPFVLNKQPFLPPVVPPPYVFSQPREDSQEASRGAPGPLLKSEGSPGRQSGSVGGGGRACFQEDRQQKIGPLHTPQPAPPAHTPQPNSGPRLFFQANSGER